MLQRKQTLWLALILFITFSSVSLDIYFYEIEGKLDGKVLEDANAQVGFSQTTITIEKVKERHHSNTFLKYVTLLVGLLALASIVLFKQRDKQIVLTKLIYLMLFVMAGLMYYYGWSKRYVDLQPDGQITISIIFPLILAWANFKAIKGIKHDDNLVKSYDRIR